ncbi:methyltransferase domain-containing protein [Conexibacter sp. W3-3-2]|uniref:class I SAM-dependent methyltransferase n=1 Tax=Conexibacter sp. W3-3-2 TaxID=2675227 RepID=UPI0012B6C3B3|nr:class I SAM-dependent methyltransferase [Conexibacter sp. W3-3-2]MTD46810.1 methyltransferase domain-containing protein [Conexibacter sp. W3-3-2]
MPSPATATPEEIRDVNTRYHDGAAAQYDAKWGIDFGAIGQRQVLGKLEKALGAPLPVYDRALEIGAGTGYFTLNLMQAGVVRAAVCSDISQGMMDTCAGNAARLGLDVETVVTDAEKLPFEDASFDLVLGHAVLHHLPDLDQAFREFFRVLKPGGTLYFAGEPSEIGDRIAAYPKRGATRVAPLWRAVLRARKAPEGHTDGGAENHQLESVVDVHAFVPDDLRGHATQAGFSAVKVRGEELLANWFGWANRALESSAEQEDVPWLWRQYAYRGYLAFQAVDRALLESRLPPQIFYNLIVSARKPD